MKCSNCSAELVLGKVNQYHYQESGLDDIYLGGVDLYRCARCDAKLLGIKNINQLHLAIALHIVERDHILTGPEIRFLRKVSKMKAKDFAKELGYDPSTLSRYENEKDVIADQGSLLIRLWFRDANSRKIQRYEQLCEDPLVVNWIVGRLETLGEEPGLDGDMPVSNGVLLQEIRNSPNQFDTKSR